MLPAFNIVSMDFSLPLQIWKTLFVVVVNVLLRLLRFSFSRSYEANHFYHDKSFVHMSNPFDGELHEGHYL